MYNKFHIIKRYSGLSLLQFIMLLFIHFKITDVWNVTHIVYPYIFNKLICIYRYIVINKITTHPLPQ